MTDLADQLKTEMRYREARGAKPPELLMLFDAWCLALDARPASQRPLTPRQAELLPLILSGQPMKVCAQQMGVSLDTIKDHAACIYRKYGVTSRYALTAHLLPAGHGC